MTHKLTLRLTALLLILIPIVFMTFFTLLAMNFEYPDILREPTEHILTEFAAGGDELVATWYGFMLSSLMFVPLALLVRRSLPDMPYRDTALTMGVLAGVLQTLGLIRWPFIVPYLSDLYLDPASSEATREAVAVTFGAFHRYAGVALGEHLGFLFTGVWTLFIAVGLWDGRVIGRWFSLIGAVLGVGIIIGMAEPGGWAAAADINAIAYSLWAVWLIILGGAMWRHASRADLTPAA